MRSVTRNRAVGTWVVCLLLAASPVFAQEQAEQPPSVGEIVKLTVASYKGLRTYQGSGHLIAEMQTQGTPMKQELPMSITYAAGSKFRVMSQRSQIFCDGQQVTVYVPPLRQYTVREFGPDFWEEDMARLGVLPKEIRPDKLFGAQDPVAEYRRMISEASVTGSEAVGGYQCWLVQGHFSVPKEAPFQGRVPLKIWHRKGDGLVTQIRADLTELVRAQMAARGQDAGMQFDSVAFVYNAGQISLDEELPEDAFVFQPPADAEKVERFGPPEMPQAQEEQVEAELEGEPAPDFELKALDGSTVKLSGLKGKVVVLDFWASWCGPCRQEMPELEQLWQKVRDKDVVIFGVNQRESAEAAGKAADSFGVTFPIVLDSNGATGNAYGVSGIPTVVIIDGAGVVRGWHVGYRPGIGKQLEEEIEKLLGAE